MGHVSRTRFAGRMALAGTVATLLAGTAQAQQSILLPAISVVSATLVPTPIDQIGSSVTVITSNEMERDQRRTVPDALSAVPGLHLVQTGGPGGQTAVFIRGTNANHVKVLLDGIDISDPTSPNGAVDLAHLLTSDLERIEILRGPQSGLYGANAIGGVISLTTKKGSGPPKVTAKVEAGSFGTFNQSMNLGGSTDRFNYSFDVAHFQARSTPVTPAYILPPGQASVGDYYDNMTYSTKLGVDLTESLTLNFVGRFTDSKYRFTNDSFSFATFTFVPNTEQTRQAARQFFGRGEAVWSLFDGVFVNRFGVNYTDYNRSTKDPDPASQLVFKGSREKYDWRGNIAFTPDQMLVLGLEHETDRLNVPSTSAQRSNRAAYAELQLAWAKRLFLVSNIRVDDNENFGVHTTWRVAPAVLVPTTETKLKGSYGTGFKAPTLLELFGDDPTFFFVANRQLQPEKSTGYDFGFEQPVAPINARFGATYFRNDITNLINFVQLAPTLFSNTNIGQATMFGYEAFFAIALTDQVTFRGDITQTIARNAITGAELVRRPKSKHSATVVWRPTDQWTVAATALFVSSWTDFDRPTSASVTAPAYHTVNLAVNYKAGKNVVLFARVDNLFDRRFENPLGWENPGLGAYAGLRVTN